MTKHRRNRLLSALALATLALTAHAEPLCVSATSNVAVTLYGKIEMDALWTDSAAPYGDAANTVGDESAAPNDAETRITALITRIGLRLAGPTTGVAALSGKLEADFGGLGGSETSPNLRLRHAFAAAALPMGVTVLAGQTDDLVGMLYPPTLDTNVLWSSGDIGARRPQIRLGEGVGLGTSGKLDLALAASRTIGQAVGGQADTGRSADMPTLQARVAACGPLWVEGQKASLGLAGAYGREQIFVDAGNAINLEVKALAADWQLPLAGPLALWGEAYVGENLDAFYASQGRGVILKTPLDQSVACRAFGGWASLTLKPWAAWSFSAGAGFDKVDAADLPAAAAWRTQAVFANAIYTLAPGATVGLEYGWVDTSYLGRGESTLNRAQTTVAYGF